jgi:hypothetical protein|tara:strand:- start:104 stop:889 length:786 start_codon:yes stop_codon:yes gene_type:complete
MKFTYVLLLSIFFSTVVSGQKNSVTNKQYILVKSTFDFLKQVDRYKANSFTKFLFTKAGFNVYLDNEELPEELYYNKCSAIYVDVKDKSNLFATKNYIELVDCNGRLLYTSKTGSSKLKDYEKSYRQSIRNAFSTIENLNAIYSSFSSTKVETSKKENKDQELMILSNIKEDETLQLVSVDLSIEEVKKSNYPRLNAQKNKMGYQLINTKKELVFVVLNTSNKNLFIFKNKKGILINKGNYWIAEYYEDQQLITKQLQIRF